MKVPREYELCAPTVQALRSLGGAGSIQDIAQAVINQMQLPKELVWQTHGNTCKTELEYRLAWARTVLKTCGFVENPKRGFWALTEEGLCQSRIDPEEIRKMYLEQRPVHLSLAVAPSTESHQPDLGEDEFWDRLTTEQFFAGYAEEDVLHDTDLGVHRDTRLVML